MNRKGWTIVLTLLGMAVVGVFCGGWLWRQLLAMHGHH
jgi:hypothetical protein